VSGLDHTLALRTATRLPAWLSAGLAIVAGWLMDLGFPDQGWWPFTLAGLILMLFAARGLTLPQALWVGALGGFSYYGILITWLTVYLGLVPWLALTLAQTVLFSLGFVLLTLMWRVGERQWPSLRARLGFLPLALAGVWMVREAIAAVWPFGGFAWGRLAHSQAQGPALEWVAWLGTSGLSFLLAWFAALVVVVVTEPRLARLQQATLPLGALTFLVVWPAYPATISDTIRVAAIQGNTDASLFSSSSRGDNLMDHWAVTKELYGEKVDVVIWPENASDIDPLRHSEAATILDDVVTNMDAPLVVGTITAQGDETFNSVLLWDVPDNPGVGYAADQYDKIHPVPFAEYLPAREFFYPLAPDMFDMVPRDYSFGERDTVFGVAGHTAGVAICYDIVDDAIFWQMMDEGADVIFAPTNNADFGRTDQSEQQLDIATIRAVETGRTVVNTSTVGTSAIILPTGEELVRLPTFTEGFMLEDIPTTSHTTPATRLGRSLELGVSALGLASLAIGWWARRRGEFDAPLPSRSDR